MEWWNYGALQISSHFLKFCKNYYFVCMRVSWRPEEGHESPGTRITDGFELPCGCWRSKLVLWDSSRAFNC